MGSGLPVQVPEGTTIPEVFLAQAARNPGRAAVADQTGGVRTYRDLVTVILALRPALQAIPGPSVGIMLPASGGAAAAFLAVACAGKIPVMVNWSTGIKNMVHGLDLLGVAKVLTADPVVARIQSQGMDLGPLGDRLLPLERVGASLSRAAKLRAWAKARLSWAELRRPVPATAVVLFTSGSEALPKAVPLTHANLLANVRDVVAETAAARGPDPGHAAAVPFLRRDRHGGPAPVRRDQGRLPPGAHRRRGAGPARGSLRGHPPGGHAHLPGRHRAGGGG